MKRKTKIICTIGPASDNPQVLADLMDAGMNVARLNFSHENYESHSRRIKLIRKIANEKNLNIAIMLDTKGPEIRTGDFKDNLQYFKKGDFVTIKKEPVLGTNKEFSLQVPEIFKDFKVGDYLLIDDGKMRFDIVEISKKLDLKCKVYNNGYLKSKKGVNVPNVKLSVPFISEKDEEDIKFGIKVGVDLIAASFCRSKENALAIRKILDDNGGKNIDIIAKIENHEGVDNLSGILEVVDGIMVARGDLGVEVGPALVPIYQKQLIKKANEFGKPVITATHMLESMTSSPRPTRAEASDVANAILDGTDAIMLSGETAAGEYPIEAVKTMDTIARATEKIIPYELNLQSSIKSSQKTINDAIGIAVSQTAMSLPSVDCIIAFTETGGTARRMCKFRPEVPIIAVTNNQKTADRLTYYWGVFPIIDLDFDNYAESDNIAIKAAKKFGFKSGSTIIITSGWGQAHGRTNTMRIIDIP